jgi:hypothetical protein
VIRHAYIGTEPKEKNEEGRIIALPLFPPKKRSQQERKKNQMHQG